jgi:ATP-binding cassette subfamily B protein
MIHKKAQAIMNNYDLNKPINEKKKGLLVSIKEFLPFLKEQKSQIILATIAAFTTSGLNLLAPILIGRAVDKYIQKSEFHGVLVYGAIILAIYIGAVISSYFQTLLMGRVGQNVLFGLRNAIFKKLGNLPVAFFNQNKAGDLISRINNDTDKLNQFFSQSLVQFVANIITIIGGVVFVLAINWEIGLIALAPVAFLLVFTRVLSPWIKQKNFINQKNLGGMSGEVSESIDNFKVIVAFNRRDYFREKFREVNELNYNSAVSAGIANNTLTPTYGFASGIAQLLVIVFGLTFIASGNFTLGLLISFLSYVNIIYNPLKQMATVWSSFQTAFASWDRINAILEIDSDLIKIPSIDTKPTQHLIEFKDVSFSYPNGKEVLHNINFTFKRGKTYALVGPTGGGKTTTASLIARLYDPSKGIVLLDGKDIRSYNDQERANKIGFILQEPFLFTGTVRDNIIYSNEKYFKLTNEELVNVLHENGLEILLQHFEEGLDTGVTATGSKLSLGQKQLIAFIRAVLRNPELIILDEATANIDTITEKLLEDILKKLPKETTLVIIAHRLNTIENADEIFFVNSGEVIRAGSMEHAVDMLLHSKREN